MLDKAAPLAPKRTRLALLDHLKTLRVKFVLNSKVLYINVDGIDYEENNEMHSIKDYDNIVLAFGSKSNNKLYKEFENQSHIHIIGDAKATSDAKQAIFEATKLALKL